MADDFLQGRPGGDRNSAGGENDNVQAGSGDDTACGGLGADEFQVHINPDGTTAPVQIRDFVSGVDRIEIHFLDETDVGDVTLTAGRDNTTNIVIGGAVYAVLQATAPSQVSDGDIAVVELQ